MNTATRLAALLSDETCRLVSVEDLSDPQLAKHLGLDALDLLGIQNRIDCEFGNIADDEIARCFDRHDPRPFAELVGVIDAKLAAKREGVAHA
jgi:hypothetical protein